MGTVWADTRTRQGRNAVLTQVMANNCVHFVTLAKDSPVISEKYAALLSVLKKKFENRFEGCKKMYQLTFETPFSVGINSLPVNFPMECIELQSHSTEKSDPDSLPDFQRPSLARRPLKGL